jgi:hypothetical protein
MKRTLNMQRHREARRLNDSLAKVLRKIHTHLLRKWPNVRDANTSGVPGECFNRWSRDQVSGGRRATL